MCSVTTSYLFSGKFETLLLESPCMLVIIALSFTSVLALAGWLQLSNHLFESTGESPRLSSVLPEVKMNKNDNIKPIVFLSNFYCKNTMKFGIFTVNINYR